jgi:hypothetical protein
MRLSPTGFKHHRGGEGEIRTHETLSGSPVFKTGAFNHSATSPQMTLYSITYTNRSKSLSYLYPAT